MSRIKLVEAHRAVSDWENSRCLSGPNSCANTSVSDMYFCTHVELRKKFPASMAESQALSTISAIRCPWAVRCWSAAYLRSACVTKTITNVPAKSMQKNKIAYVKKYR